MHFSTITPMRMNTIMIMKNAATSIITAMTIIMDITMQMKSLQAGAKRL